MPTIQILINMIVNLLKDKESNREKLFRISKSCIGLDVSRYYDDVGCMETVNKLYELATGKPILAGLVSTIRGLEIFESDSRFKETIEPRPGYIIISATEGRNIGHVGVISDNEKILANNSSNSRVEEKYTRESWIKFYTIDKGLTTRFFKVL